LEPRLANGPGFIPPLRAALIAVKEPEKLELKYDVTSWIHAPDIDSPELAHVEAVTTVFWFAWAGPKRRNDELIEAMEAAALTSC
jgi:hypothetical protein